MLISAIVTTYNRPDALQAVLDGLAAQHDRGFEVLIADDGSNADTRTLIEQARRTFPVPLSHVWQEDRGFRAGAARNRAAERASGAYLLFLDGDCIPRRDFIAQHRALAEPGWMVAGNRVLLSQDLTQRALSQRLALHDWESGQWTAARAQKEVNRTFPLARLPLGALRKLGSRRWQRIRTCNVAVWKSDFDRVRGFDETFEGWGFEDSDLAVRLLNAGVRRKDGSFATAVLHLWHPENDRSHEGRNWELLQQRIRTRETQPLRGLQTADGATDS